MVKEKKRQAQKLLLPYRMFYGNRKMSCILERPEAHNEVLSREKFSICYSLNKKNTEKTKGNKRKKEIKKKYGTNTSKTEVINTLQSC